MSKKTRKTKVEDQEVTNIAGEENQTMEVNSTEMEGVPPTIVEANEEMVFGAPADVVEVEGTKVEVETEGQNHSVVQAAQSEQPAAKKPKVDKRPYIPFLTEALETPQDRKEMLKTILEKWPQVSKGGVQTFLTDMLNPKYSFFKDRPVTKLSDGKVCFADKAPVAVSEEVKEVPVEEVVSTPVTEAPAELPVE